jgi:hypothetical protein
MSERKTRRQPWTEWWPSGAEIPPDNSLFTAADIIGQLAGRGINVDSDDLQFWAFAGALPGPIRRRRDGATRGLYPDVFVQAVQELHRLQGEGVSLDDARWQIRSHFQKKALEDSNPSDEAWLEFTGKQHAANYRLHIPKDIVDGLLKIATQRERITGIPTEQIDINVAVPSKQARVAITGADGRKLVYAVDENGSTS